MNACIFVYAYYCRTKYQGHYQLISDTKVKDSFYRKSRDQVITGTCTGNVHQEDGLQKEFFWL